MHHECGSCGGSGKCQNDHHGLISGSVTTTIEILSGLSDPCPACGESAATPGKCSVCGGSGYQDD